MPRYFLAGFFISCSLLNFPAAVHAAEWRQCEKAKVRQLDLQQARRAESPAHKRKGSRRGGKPDSVEQLDDWLWKNCREYSYELRALEQQRM